MADNVENLIHEMLRRVHSKLDELWKRLLPDEPLSVQTLSEGIEDYCLNKAMDEARDTPLLSREEALKYLEE
jgi:hypothetical protein